MRRPRSLQEPVVPPTGSSYWNAASERITFRETEAGRSWPEGLGGLNG